MQNQASDHESGLHYNYHRYYDPATGRYLTPDPIGFAGQDLNLFSYTANNPVNRIDPYGLDWLNRLFWGTDKIVPLPGAKERAERNSNAPQTDYSVLYNWYKMPPIEVRVQNIKAFAAPRAEILGDVYYQFYVVSQTQDYKGARGNYFITFMQQYNDRQGNNNTSKDDCP